MKCGEIGEWSEIKLEIIKEYAGAYTGILSKKEWFGGSGVMSTLMTNLPALFKKPLDLV